MAPDSLYAATKLARVVQKVKECFKSRIQKCIISAKPSNGPQSTMLPPYDRKTLSNIIKSQATSDRHLSRCHTASLSRRDRQDADPSSLLKDLDLYAQSGDLSLHAVAAQDSLFLRHEFHPATIVKNLENVYGILDLTTALLGRLQDLSHGDGARYHDSDILRGNFKCEKFLANLEHLLRCLRQIALDAIIRHCFQIVEAHILHWHEYWQHQKRIDEGWFAEWPNGQRPLNTTWPWNVKPALLVLWGVCWMFYAPNAPSASNPRETRNPRGAAPIVEASGDFRTRQVGTQSQPVPEVLPDPSDTWINPPSNTYPIYSWLHPQQAGVRPWRANATLSQAVLPSYQASVSANPYITTTSNDPSDLFAASTIQWPYCQGINQDPPAVYAPTYAPWQSSYNTNDGITGTLTATPQRLDPSTPSQSYAPQRQADTNLQAAVGSAGALGFSLGSHLQNMRDYPSPHSNVSEQTTSSCLSVVSGAMMSPGRPMVPSPSIVRSLGGSESSRQSSRRSTEPPRNVQGVLYCSHPDCANKPSVFSRKCEWTKHMDKHNRPYICEEPECDNIRGFTYSGGLLRHQREVHRQHGGPKATCMCPYKDCKRSTGVGFSRKENLNEHLRRCHQPRRDSQAQSPADTQDVSSPSRPRKRRRGGNDDDGVGEDEPEGEGDLKREVKKLRRELAEKDERLRRLEKMMETLTGNKGAPR